MAAGSETTSDCVICRHRRVAEIDAAQEAGEGELDIAQRFRVSKAALRKHAAHRAKGPKPEQKAAEVIPIRRPTTPAASRTAPALLTGSASEADSGAAGELKAVANVRARCLALVEKVEALIERADSDEDISWRERAALIVAAKQVLELLGRLTGEIGPAAEVMIVESPRWKRIEAKIAEALAAFPEAAAAVAKALQDMEAA